MTIEKARECFEKTSTNTIGTIELLLTETYGRNYTVQFKTGGVAKNRKGVIRSPF